MADPEKTGSTGTAEESQPTPQTATRFTLQDELFIFCSLMLFTCFFLPWKEADKEVTPWNRFSSFDSTADSVGLGFLLLLCVLSLWSVFQPRFRPWFGIITASVVNGAILAFSALPGRSVYGADLSSLFALGLLVLSANPAILRAGDLAMRRLNSRSAEVFTHWGTVLPGIHFSAHDFYAKLETEIRTRAWPGVEFLRVRFTEAGLLSHKREYLRVIRQRQVFDVCAANFGRDYFFTLREAEIKPQLTLSTLLIFLTALYLYFFMCLSVLGPFPGLVIFGNHLVLGVLLLMNVLRLGWTRCDGLLMRTPVIGPVYETFFRRSTTYFQHDTRMVFLKLMDDLLKQQVDEETSAQGVKLLSCFEHQPLLDGLYKTSTRTLKDQR